MNTHPAYQAVLFDLDGTLTDSAPGIERSIAHTLVQLGAPALDATALRAWIGPDLRASFVTYLGNRDRAEQAMQIYRERYTRIGMFENSVYPGIPALLDALHAAGVRLLLATSKPQPYAQRILEHFGLAGSFAVIGGATLDGRVSSKAEVIATLLPQLRPAERAACVLVGDRAQDIIGAQEHNLPCIAVGYGYGSHDELTAHQPTRIVASVDALHAALLPPGQPAHAHEAGDA